MKKLILIMFALLLFGIVGATDQYYTNRVNYELTNPANNEIIKFYLDNGVLYLINSDNIVLDSLYTTTMEAVTAYISTNNSWWKAKNSGGTWNNLIKLNASDYIEFGAPVMFGYWEFVEDAGVVTAMDMPISDTPVDGTVEGYVFRLDSNNCFGAYSQANSSGGVYALGKVVYGANATTTDATVTTLDYFTMTDNSAVYLEVKVIAMESDGSSRNVYHLSGLFYRDDGNATQQGGTNSICEIESEANCACIFDVNGNTVRVRITGVVGETWNWDCHIENISQK